MTKRFFTLILGFLLIVAVGLQFFQPERNTSPNDLPGDLINNAEISDTVAVILLVSCYDCHSNNTQYPWYSRISPVSWYLNKHVIEGKENLNFSDWAQLSKAEKIGKLDEICEEMEYEKMPLESYLLIHRDARLSPEQISLVCEWTEAEAMKIIRDK